MLKEKEIRNKALEYAGLFFNRYQWLSDMDALVDEVKSAQQVGVIYGKVMRLAAYNVTLGELVAEFVMRANSAYIYRKFKFADQFSSLSDGTTIRNNIAEKSVIDERTHEISIRYLADLLKAKHDNVDRLISSVQTKVKIEERESRNG